MVRTLLFQGTDTGSIPVRVIMLGRLSMAGMGASSGYFALRMYKEKRLQDRQDLELKNKHQLDLQKVKNDFSMKKAENITNSKNSAQVQNGFKPEPSEEKFKLEGNIDLKNLTVNGSGTKDVTYSVNESFLSFFVDLDFYQLFLVLIYFCFTVLLYCYIIYYLYKLYCEYGFQDSFKILKKDLLDLSQFLRKTLGIFIVYFLIIYLLYISFIYDFKFNSLNTFRELSLEKDTAIIEAIVSDRKELNLLKEELLNLKEQLKILKENP